MSPFGYGIMRRILGGASLSERRDGLSLLPVDDFEVQFSTERVVRRVVGCCQGGFSGRVRSISSGCGESAPVVSRPLHS